MRPGQPYQVTETGPAGYHADPVSCVVVGSPVQRASAGIVTPQAGEDLVCTFTNVHDTARLTLVKTVTNDNGGTAVADRLDADRRRARPRSPDHRVRPRSPTPVVNAGTYTLSE